MILTRSTRLNQPRGPVEVDRQNLLADGIEFAYIPGFSRDLNGKHGTIQSVGPNTSFLNGTMVTPGTGRNNGLILASGALLGPLQNSTVLAIVNTRAGLVTGTGIENDGLIGSGGNAIYSERAPTGNDIYKLSLTALTGPTLNAEFTYRNDGATLLQQRAVISGYNDGRQLAVAAVKNGTSHSVYCESISSTGTFGSASSAFTNANIQRRLGSDVADITSAWNGQTLLVVGWSRALSAYEIAEVKDNPWQLFRPVQRRVYFDVGSIAPPSEHILTAESAIQQILCEVGTIAQENTLAGGISVQSAVSSDGIIQQINTLIGENSFSNNLSAVAALAQLNILQGNNQQTINLSSDSSVSQINNLSALSTAVEMVSSSAGILQNNILLANSCLVPNYSASGSIALVPVTDLSGNSVSQYDLSSSSNLLQDHILAQNASEQAVLSSSSAVVQNHVLISNNSTQIVLSSSGAIGTSGSLLGNNAQQTNTSSAGFIIQASFLQGNVVKQLNLSSSGAITQGGELPPLTDAEIRQMFAMLQVAVAKLQTRIDAVL